MVLRAALLSAWVASLVCVSGCDQVKTRLEHLGSGPPKSESVAEPEPRAGKDGAETPVTKTPPPPPPMSPEPKRRSPDPIRPPVFIDD